MPILPGSDGPVDSEEKALKVAEEIGYPVIIKATAGGGGRGMRVVRDAGELSHRSYDRRSAKPRRRSASATSTSRSTSTSPRHIEFQILGDQHGNVVHLGERECSIQRRHQKLIEEVAVAGAHRRRCAREMGASSSTRAKAVQYTNAGTFEFLMDETGEFYFIEVNTRAPGRASGHRDGHRHRHRQGADPDRGGRAAAVQAGRRRLHRPRDRVPHQRRGSRDLRAVAGPHPRLQRARRPRRARRHVRPLRLHHPAVLRLADRQADRARRYARRSHRAHERALDMFVVEGIHTSIPLHQRIVEHPSFLAGQLSTKFLENMKSEVV